MPFFIWLGPQTLCLPIRQDMDIFQCGWWTWREQLSPWNEGIDSSCNLHTFPSFYLKHLLAVRFTVMYKMFVLRNGADRTSHGHIIVIIVCLSLTKKPIGPTVGPLVSKSILPEKREREREREREERKEWMQGNLITSYHYNLWP